MTTHGRRALLATLLLALSVGCSGDSSVKPDVPPSDALAARGAPERQLAIELATTAAGDAGMIFSIEGPNIAGITAAPGYQLVHVLTDARNPVRVDVLLVGPLQSGVVAWLQTRGVNSGNPYRTEVTQVAAGAAGNFAQRQALGAYSLVIRRER